MVEFTGERVIPGEVEVDLWNEHLARYRFAARLAAGRRVLDAGCGMGYGSAELAQRAGTVTGIDISPEAVHYARGHYPAPHFVAGSCTALPFAPASFDLVVAYEVIEHVAAWEELFDELARVLAPAGLLVISTPNKLYYADSRRKTGPNPFHVHEFEFDEFAAECGKRFPHTALFLENHVEGIGFQCWQGAGIELGAGPDLPAPSPADAHFFLSVCSRAPLPEVPGFLYLPSAANVLRERERHIERLQQELAVKDGWLADLRQEKQNLIEMFRKQKVELDRSNQWGRELDETLRAARARVVQLQEEIAQATAGYEAKIASLDEENRRSVEWALGLEAELEAKGNELVKCVELLDTAEQTVEERTKWAQRLDAQVQELEGVLNLVRGSRWLKLGRTVGLGPELGKR